MTLPLRLWAAMLGSLVLLPRLSQAQCPTAASCTPGAASAASSLTAVYKMGIYNVTLGSINNTTSGYTDGFKDYSCTLSTSLTVSTPTSITVKNGTMANENVRVWIDYNNDGVFGSTELAFSSDGKMTHTGTITPPATAVLNTKLRLRVASDYSLGTVPTACSTPQYSQDEDYGVTLVANANPPVAAFTTNATTTCTGTVQFTDQSTNGPTTWLWNFGDNTTSTAQNPSHTYTTAGTYQVTLTVTNAAGSSTSAVTTLTYNSSVPVAASCAGLAASGYCCNYGITQVKLGTLTNNSADGNAGYQDFTCTQRVTLAVGTAYALAITTGGTNPHDTRAWLDLNNDGVLAASEKVFEVLNSTNPSASLTLPATATLNQPLRLRIVADGIGTNPAPCAAPTLGQVEDYTVTLIPNPNPPVADFTSNYVATTCSSSNAYTFTDQSTYGPTAWLWSFSPSTGITFLNGTSSTSQNPQVKFATPGYYSVTLKASNVNGSNSITKSNYILVQSPCLTYCTSNGGFTTTSSGFWITSVGVTAPPSGSAYTNASANSTSGYTYFASAPISLLPGGTQTISVTTNVAITHRTSIWIDYNRDGVFSNTTGAGGELVYNASVTGTATASAAIAVPTTLNITRMRIQVALDTNTPNACATYYGQGEVEDYLVQPTTLASQPALALPSLTLSPNPTLDGELQVQVGEPSASGRYSVLVTNSLGTELLRQPLQLSPGAPATLNLAQLPAGLYLVRLTNEQGQTALRRVVRQ